jgi:hypothetical protein
MDEAKRLRLIAEAVKYCQTVDRLGMRPAHYTKALREPVHFLWACRNGPKHTIARYRSEAAVGLKSGKREIVHDHAIPFGYLQKQLLKLKPVTPVKVKTLLEQFETIVIITADEDRLLSRAGYGSKMPPNWDGVDKLARYRAVGIRLVENAQRPGEGTLR